MSPRKQRRPAKINLGCTVVMAMVNRFGRPLHNIHRDLVERVIPSTLCLDLCWIRPLPGLARSDQAKRNTEQDASVLSLISPPFGLKTKEGAPGMPKSASTD
jgi:hypothetical protein